jgi:hypothetical protein
VEGEVEERARVDGDLGAALATLELAQGRLGVVNLQHDKLSELLANQEREKKGAKGCYLSPAATMARRRRKNRGGGAAVSSSGG